MTDYSQDIKEQAIIYESDEYVACHPHGLPGYIHVYHLCTYHTPLKRHEKRGWLCCGAWYLRDNGKYYDSGNQYGNGLGSADSIEEIISKVRGRHEQSKI